MHNAIKHRMCLMFRCEKAMSSLLDYCTALYKKYDIDAQGNVAELSKYQFERININ